MEPRGTTSLNIEEIAIELSDLKKFELVFWIFEFGQDSKKLSLDFVFEVLFGA